MDKRREAATLDKWDFYPALGDCLPYVVVETEQDTHFIAHCRTDHERMSRALKYVLVGLVEQCYVCIRNCRFAQF